MSTRNNALPTSLFLAAALALVGCGDGMGDDTESELGTLLLDGTWQVREVADDNYPGAGEGLLCTYTEEGSMSLDEDGIGTLELTYTTECTDDSQTEWTYAFDITSEHLSGTDYRLYLDGDEGSEDLDCVLDDVGGTLNCEDDDADNWRFIR